MLHGGDPLKGATVRQGFRILKSLAQILQVPHSSNMSIFSIHNHPCSFMLYNYSISPAFFYNNIF